MADVKVGDVPNRAPLGPDKIPLLESKEHTTINQIKTFSEPANKAVLDNITDAGSGQIITSAERTAIADNTTDIATNTDNLSRKDTVQTINPATGTVAFDANSGYSGIFTVTGNLTIDIQNSTALSEGIFKFKNGTGFTVTIQRSGSGADVQKVASGGTIPGIAESLSSTGSTYDVIVWTYEGENLIYNHVTE